MRNLKFIIFFTIASTLGASTAFAQGKSNNSTNNNIAVQVQQNGAQEEATSTQQPFVNYKTAKPINTPAATAGADYDSNIVTGLDDYNSRKKALLERAIEIQKAKEEEYRRQAYEKALKQAQERAKGKNSKPSSNQDYFDRQTKIMQEQKDVK